MAEPRHASTLDLHVDVNAHDSTLLLRCIYFAGAIIRLGSSHLFRFNDPGEAARLRQEMKNVMDVCWLIFVSSSRVAGIFCYYWHCPHSMQSRVYEMVWYLSVFLSMGLQLQTAAAYLRLWAQWAEDTDQLLQLWHVAGQCRQCCIVSIPHTFLVEHRHVVI